METRKLSLQEMEMVQGGTATDVCNVIFYGTSVALGLAAAVATGGMAVAVAGWALSSWIGGIGLVACR